ncbi:S-layer homology domain-containing protein [Domibacillus sp.]|uniref:S-layer homology domain-containing protein n=1 Tax=Domibacillus sp. TaxID=1969783 RepID=UPI0028124BA2|nr:S-layer homology domain-containing protein [Domibacillus sp.]
MKKFVTSLFLSSLLFSLVLFVPAFASAQENVTEKPEWEVPAEIYNILRERAGMTVYTHTHKPVDFNNMKYGFTNIYEQTPNYIIARPHNTKDYMLVSKDGFYAAYTSKEKGAAVDAENGSMLWRTLRNYAFEDIWDEDNQYGYFHFGQPKAADLVGDVFLNEDFLIPEGTTVYEFAVSDFDWYKQLPVDLLKVGETNVFSRWGSVNGVELDEEARYHMRGVLFLTSGGTPKLSYDPGRLHWKLENLLYPAFIDVRKDHWARENITWSFRTGLIQGFPDGRFQPLSLLKESDFTVIAAKYFGFKPGATYGHRAQQYYDFLKPYNLPLKGYANDTAKNGIVTRGQLAQVIAASQGAAYGPYSAVGFMYKNNLSSGTTGAKTFEDYHFNEPLTRAQISAFFQRMEAAGMTTLK